jgi:preprotein translocase subunit YajC
MKKLFTLAALLSGANAFGQDTPALPPPPQQDFTQTLVMIGIAFVFFYFILWRPEQQRKKEAEDKRNSMKKGDRVTAMGIIGTVHKVEEDTVIVKMVDGNKIEMLKAAISEVIPTEESSKVEPIEKK